MAKAVTKKQSNQTAKLSDPDAITSVTISKDQDYIVVTSNGGATVARHRRGDSKEFREYAAKGRSITKLSHWLSANPVPKPAAKLATGVTGQNSPQSAKAVADQKRGEKTEKKTAPKAAKNKQPAKGAERTYKLGATKNTAKEGSWRHHMLSMIMGSKDTASAKAAHAKSKKFSDNKLDFNWANAQGYIKFDK